MSGDFARSDDSRNMADMYHRWIKLLRLFLITDDPVSLISKRRRLIMLNILMTVFFLFNSVRIGFSGLTDRFAHHIMGHTLVHTGNVNRLFMLIAGIVQVQMALTRIVNVRSLTIGDNGLERVLKKLLTEPDDGVRRHKQKVAGITYNGCLLSCIMHDVAVCFMLTVILAVNVSKSTTTTEIICWCFWMTQDLLCGLLDSATMLPFPAAWLLMVLDYEIDLRVVLNHVKALTHGEPKATSTRQVISMMLKLKEAAEQVNASAAPIMLVISKA